MAYPAEHYYFAFGGSLGSQEQWSVGLRFSPAFTDDSQADEMIALNALGDVLWTEWGASDCPSGTQAKLQWAKLNRLGTDGKYLRGYTNVIDRAARTPGQMSGMPFQCSLVATLRTSAARGLASKGRIYLPAPRGVTTGTDNTRTLEEVEAAATWAARLLTGLNEAAGTGGVIVASKVRDGAARHVRAVDVGSVIDTMRSRRSSLPEVRVERPVTGLGAGADF